MANRFNFSTIKSKILLIVLLGIIGIFAVTLETFIVGKMIEKDRGIDEKSQKVLIHVFRIMMTEEKFINTRNEKILSEYEILKKDLMETIGELSTLNGNDAISNIVEKLMEQGKTHLEIFSSIHNNMQMMKKETDVLNQSFDLLLNDFVEMLKKINKEESDLMMGGEFLGPMKTGLRAEIGEYMNLWNRKIINFQQLLLHADPGNYGKKAEQLRQKTTIRETNIERVMSSLDDKIYHDSWKRIVNTTKKIADTENRFFSQWNQNLKLSNSLKISGNEMQESVLKLARFLDMETESRTDLNQKINMLLIAFIVLALLVLSTFVYRSVMQPIRYVIDGLGAGSDEVAASARQVSSASQSLAEGSSEQASSIEETSSSLEQMASMTRHNADNSRHANQLMKDTDAVVEKANRSMGELTKSMEAISEKSKESFQVIKTIDEIAFQTNLLALNAAVEAARAGEAGAGFAVVAEEVRNLAMRSAGAAGNTADLIEGVVQTINGGVSLVDQTSEAFRDVAERSSKISALIDDIATATEEQAEGIQQINTAVNGMDKITQQNAANSQESASAAQELAAQAEQMKGFVLQLRKLAGDHGTNEKVTGFPERPQKYDISKLENKPSTKKKSESMQNSGIKPEDMIPLDDEDDFEEF